MSARPAWTPREDSLLRRGWSASLPAESIARELNRSVLAVYSRAKIIDLPPKSTVKRKSPGGYAQALTLAAQRIEATTDRDDAYVTACMAQGGFAPFTEWFEERIARVRSVAA